MMARILNDWIPARLWRGKPKDAGMTKRNKSKIKNQKSKI